MVNVLPTTWGQWLLIAVMILFTLAVALLGSSGRETDDQKGESDDDLRFPPELW